jgi:hypothetical protein
MRKDTDSMALPHESQPFTTCSGESVAQGMPTISGTGLPGTRIASLILGLAVIALASGCQPNAEQRATKQLRGEWILASPDNLAERMNRDAKEKPVPDRFSGAAMGLVVDFRRGGRLRTQTEVLGETVQKVGTWKVVSTDPNAAELKTAEIEFTLGQDEPDRIRVTFLNKQNIRMVPPNIAVLEKEYEFTRKR